jgi:hypothetical protein
MEAVLGTNRDLTETEPQKIGAGRLLHGEIGLKELGVIPRCRTVNNAAMRPNHHTLAIIGRADRSP